MANLEIYELTESLSKVIALIRITNLGQARERVVRSKFNETGQIAKLA